MNKLLKVMTLFVAMALTACGGGANSQASSGAKSNPSSSAPKSSVHSHKWVEDTAAGTAATCDTAGNKVEKCECGETKNTPIPALGHDFSGAGTADAEVAGSVATETVKCARCNKYAVRWAAKDYDTTLSRDIEKTRDDGSIRMNTAQYKNNDENELGSHLVYNVNSYAEVQKAGFAFKIQQKSDWDGALFDYQSGDQQQGYIKKDDGTLELTTKRYMLKINDVVVPLGDDPTAADGVQRGTTGFYSWPVEFKLNAGINKVEIICLGGYRAYLYNFLFTGLPARAA